LTSQSTRPRCATSLATSPWQNSGSRTSPGCTLTEPPRPDKEPVLRDPRWRALAREEWDRVPRTMIPHKHPDRIRLVSVTRPDHERWVGATLADLVADRGGHPSDVLADWLLDNDVAAGIVGVGVANADPAGWPGRSPIRPRSWRTATPAPTCR
jgi:N-acyl-D-aspartate/D-glutamate deacylase